MLKRIIQKVKNYLKQVKEQRAISISKPVAIHFQSKKDIVPLHILTIILPTIGIGLEKSFAYDNENVFLFEFPTQFTIRRISHIKYTMIAVSILGFGFAFSRQLDY